MYIPTETLTVLWCLGSFSLDVIGFNRQQQKTSFNSLINEFIAKIILGCSIYALSDSTSQFYVNVSLSLKLRQLGHVRKPYERQEA